MVLITGCSSGIGREAALRFAAQGWRVFASMRRPAAAADLQAEAARRGVHLEIPIVDVTSDESVDAAVAALVASTGGQIDALVNNAGYYCYGPVEETTPVELRAQLETNVVGVLRLCRAVLPFMRARRRGTIVNISSISGLVVVPVVGPYHASKFALEALTEALRYEVQPFGVKVVLIEPGPFRTELYQKEVPVGPAAAGAPSPYAPLMRAYHREVGKLHRGDPGDVAAAILRAASSRNPRLRWRLGATSVTGGLLRRFVPDRLYELILRWAFRQGS